MIEQRPVSRGTSIGHFCTSVFEYRRDSAAIFEALTAAVTQAGLGNITTGAGVGGIFSDPDGIEIQFLPAPDTLVTAALPSDLVESRRGLLTPRGVDHVLLHVADLEKGVRFYQILYGAPAIRGENRDRVWFQIGDTPGANAMPLATRAVTWTVTAFDLLSLGAPVCPTRSNVAATASVWQAPASAGPPAASVRPSRRS